MMPEIRDQARHKWAGILAAFGIAPESLRDRHGPCPLCGGKDRFRFDDKDGRGTWICNACGAGDGMDLMLKHTNLSFADAARQIRERIGEIPDSPPGRPPIDPAAAKRAMNALWRGAAPIGNDEAGTYLAGRRLRGPYPAALRFCPSAEVAEHPSKSRLPAMLAMVSGRDGKPVNIHRTYLEHGRKARWILTGDTREASPRRMMAGKLPPGSAIRLGPHDGRLGIAEGIETALAVKRDRGLMCWAATNSTLLGQFLAGDDVRELHIFGDNDPEFGGQAAAFLCAHKNAVKRDRPALVEVHIPLAIGMDWADDLPEEIAA